ncbi:hypothetical protein GCM10029992_48780 [Glycomyces albus]
MTSRAVSAAAGVQPPTIYRLFTDMQGLLEAVAEAGFEEYLARKRELDLTEDPVADLHAGWDLHVQFGLDYPAHYLLMYGAPEQDRSIPAVEEGLARLRVLVERIAAAGRLTVGVDTAAAMVHSACVGTALGLIGAPPAERDLERSHRLREAVIGAVTGHAPSGADDLAQRAVGLKASWRGPTASCRPGSARCSTSCSTASPSIGRRDDAREIPEARRRRRRKSRRPGAESGDTRNSGDRRANPRPRSGHMQHSDIPEAIQTFVDATNAGDSEAFAAAFTADAYLNDWGREYTGRDGVRRWDGTDNIGKQSHFEVLGIEQGDRPDAYVLTVRVTGNGFNGTSPLAFELSDGLIASLRIS